MESTVQYTFVKMSAKQKLEYVSAFLMFYPYLNCWPKLQILANFYLIFF